MAKRYQSSYYTPGVYKPQYGAERWQKYEALRSVGFTKTESRTLSKLNQPHDIDVLKTMADQRFRMLKVFDKAADAAGLTGRARNNQYNKSVREWMVKHGYSSLGGVTVKQKGAKPDVMSLFHDRENKLANRAGWRKGEFDRRRDQGEKTDDIVKDPDYTSRRKGKKKTQPRRGARSKGMVAQQKARAKARSKSIPTGLNLTRRAGDTHPEMRQAWVIGLAKTVLKSPERNQQLSEQARNLGFRGGSLLDWARTHPKQLDRFDDQGNLI